MQNDNNTSRVKLQEVETKKIKKSKVVKVVVQGEKYVDVTETEKQAVATVRKLSTSEYIVESTGEIKEYKKNEKSGKDVDNLRKTFKRLRQMIRTNFTAGKTNQLFITLTYEENMTDGKRLYVDFKDFCKRLKYRLKGHKLDYIAVAEPQGRGAWHLHIMLKSDQPVLYIDNRELEKIWGLGDTETKRLKSDEVGSYYVAYFTDLLQNEKDGSKKRKKGARLSMYPKGFKFYRCSRGIKKPKEGYVKYGDIEKSGYKKTYEVAFAIADTSENRILNTIQKETWRR